MAATRTRRASGTDAAAAKLAAAAQAEVQPVVSQTRARGSSRTAPNAQRAPQRVAAKAPARTPDHEPVHEKKRQRLRKSTDVRDMFFIPLNEIPEGSSYEWKRFANVGEEDSFYLASMREQGWEPVDPKKHPDWLPPGYAKNIILKGGLILMERPIELTEEARAETRQMANRQVREAEQRLGKTPRDTLTREHPEVAPRVTKELMRMMPVEE